jgi:hypothetical protein
VRRRRSAGSAIVALALLAVVCIVVGHYAASGHHGAYYVDAGLAATVGTALGTTLLAVFTALLAWTTVRDQRERDRPVLVVTGTPRWMVIRLKKEEPGGGRLVFGLENVGLGPALGIEVTATCAAAPDASMTPAVIAAIAPGYAAQQLVIDVAFLSETAARAADFKIEGTFSDRLGRGPYPILTEWTPPPSPVQQEIEPPPVGP